MARLKRSAFVKRRNWMVAEAIEFAAPLMRAYASRRTESASDPATWRKGLLVGAHHIGDLLYRTASMPQLREALPECSWDIIAPAPSRDILIGNPHIRHYRNPPAHRVDLQRLMTEKYDVLLAYDTSGYSHALGLALELGIPNRIAFTHKGFSAWVTHPVPINLYQPFPAYFRGMIEHLAGRRFAEELRPRAYPSDEHVQQAGVILSRYGLRSSEFVVLFLSSRQPSGVCPPALLINSVKYLLRDTPFDVVLAGADTDRPLLEHAATALPARAMLAGALPLPALAALLGHAALVVTTDSGPRHMANAAGAPVAFARNILFRTREAGCYLATELDMMPGIHELVPHRKQLRIFANMRPEEWAASMVKHHKTHATQNATRNQLDNK